VIRFNPVLGTPGWIGRVVRAQFAEQRPLCHFFKPQRGDDAIEVAFLADDKIQVNLSGGLNQAFFIGRRISDAVQLLQLPVQVRKMRFKAQAKSVQDSKVGFVDAVHVAGDGRGFHL